MTFVEPVCWRGEATGQTTANEAQIMDLKIIKYCISVRFKLGSVRFKIGSVQARFGSKSDRFGSLQFAA